MKTEYKKERSYYILQPADDLRNSDCQKTLCYMSSQIGRRVYFCDIVKFFFESVLEVDIIISKCRGAMTWKREMGDYKELRSRGMENYSQLRRTRNIRWLSVLGEENRTVLMVMRFGSGGRSTVTRFSGRHDCDQEVARMISHYADDPIEIDFSTTSGALIERWTSRPSWHVVCD